MSKFLVRWRIDNTKLELPTTPEEIGKLFKPMLKMIEEDLSNGSITDWGQFGNGMDGYAISELENEIDLAAAMFKYRPYVTWDIFAVLGVDESTTVIDQAAAKMHFDETLKR